MLSTFTCQGCGSHDLAVIHEYTTTIHFMAHVPCTCEPERRRIAVVRHFHVTVVSQESGCLRENYRWIVEEHEDTACSPEIEDSREIRCLPCAEYISEEESEITEVARGVDGQSHTLSVRCDGCCRDIEPATIPIQAYMKEYPGGT
jgi:hypothetical protein